MSRRDAPGQEPRAGATLEARLLARLFHALGGDAAWFRETARPRLLALLDELPVPGPGASPDPSAAVRALAAAAQRAEAWDPGHPITPVGPAVAESRLDLACAALCAARQGALASAPGSDPFARAARRLVIDGIWSLNSRTGRWFRAGSQWALLWPLAGRDLLAVLSGADLAERTPDGVLQGLEQAGYLSVPAPSAVFAAHRADGRLLTVVAVAPCFAHSAGLAASAIAAAESLDAGGQPSGL